MKIRAAARTDTGRVRQNNQDAAYEGVRLYAVADGMGGHAAGEVASQVAVEAFQTVDDEPTIETLVDGVRRANRAVFDRAAENPEYRGMGTTLCAVAIVPGEDGHDQIAWVNVGDSRVYLLRDGELIQLSHDHSLVEDMVREGRMTKDEARVHPQRNIVTRVLGIEPDVEVDIEPVDPYEGDRFLLCSDGLVDEVDDRKIESVLRRLARPDEAADELVRLANEGGGRDNITVVVVDVVDDDDRAAEASAALADDRTRAGTLRAAPAVTVDRPRPEAAPQPEAKAREPRPRRFTWRVALFVLAVLAVLAAAGVAIGWFARGTYHVAFARDEVTIFKGRPGGLFWFDPTVEERTGIARDDVPRTFADEIEDKREFSSLDNAESYIARLEERIGGGDEDRPGSSTTTRRQTTTTR